MNPRDTHINDTQFKKLLHNDNYYKQIFKKTEKIVSVIFYILNNIDVEKKSETHVSNIAGKAHFVHENALRTLEVKPASSKEVLEQFAQAFIGLDSTLRIASVSGVITAEVMNVLTSEIDVVLRGLRTYLQDSGLQDSSFFDQLTASMTTATKPTPKTPPRSSTPASALISSGVQRPPQANSTIDRRDRIRTILEAKGEATIKDISEIITDCSEKTIQRELNAMIEDNVVKRQGERRWSKYSVF